MLIEKELDNVKWFKDDELRIKIVNIDNISIITVLLDNYNICFKMMMFEFINSILNEKGINIAAERNSYKQVVFKVDISNYMVAVEYIVSFVREWNIRVSESTVDNSDIITDENWYNE